MAQKLTTSGRVVGLKQALVARVETLDTIDGKNRAESVLLVPAGAQFEAELAAGCAAVLFEDALDGDQISRIAAPVLHGYRDLSHLKRGYIVTISDKTGFTRTLYRPDSRFNSVFTTDRCNSNCLMCSQPPKDEDDSYLVEQNLRMLSLIETAPDYMGITGGEPTLLKDDLIRILEALKTRLPTTYVHMLTNGRMYSYPEFVAKVAAVQHPSFTSAIPLYADIADVHDYVVQAKGAFDQTVEGIYNAAAVGIDVEIRIVLHKQTIPRLGKLVEFVYRNFPFVKHVALMGLENMGYVKKNWDTLWIDPVDYAADLERAVTYLWRRQMHVSIYNLQLCLLPKSLWAFARQSISDYKNIYLRACAECDLNDRCAGVFKSSETRHSAHIAPIKFGQVRAA